MNFIPAVFSLGLALLSVSPVFPTDPRIGFAGGGGSSSGGGGGGSSYSSSGDGVAIDSPEDALVMLIIIAIATPIAIVAAKNKRRAKAARNNNTAEEKQIHTLARQIFEEYQKDWTALDAERIKKYTTESYARHAGYMIELLQSEHRVNKVSELKIHEVFQLDPINSKTPLPASVRIEYEFSGLDEVLDTQNDKTLYRNRANRISETWNFIWDGANLKLDGISQPTESASHLVQSLRAFAIQNDLYYSPDWGRYALPARGLIFGGTSMRIADINNHTIGKWGDLLIQLYTYSQNPGNPSAYYIVGQITLPKSYLGVIVKSRKYKTARKPDKTYQKYELEWPDFNKRYEVYAAQRDALPAFELLNPKFMEILYAKNPAYNLEVVDDTIYIFANIKRITEQDYADLLEILRLAHKELKS